MSIARCHNFPRAILLSAATATSIAAAIPASAAAADAPVRAISIDQNGMALSSIRPIAVAPDGREVLAVISDSLGGQPVIRNVTTNTTTAILSEGDNVVGASSDLQKVLFETRASFSPMDANGQGDFYVWNRQTGTKTLVSRDASGTAIGSDYFASDDPGSTYVAQADISGNGNVVEFQESHRPAADAPDQNTNLADQWRFNLTTGALTKTADGRGTDVLALDDAGNVAVTEDAFYVGTKRFDFPFPASSGSYETRISPDGTAAVVWPSFATPAAYVVDLTTGTKRALTLPSWVTPGFNIWAVTNGGTRVLMSTVLNRGQGDRNVFGWMEQNGSLAQYGGDVPLVSRTVTGAVSPNEAFVATPNQLAQLGTTPIPGTAPPLTFTPKVSDYVTIADSECIQNFWYVTYTRPVMKLGGAVGADLRTPVSAQVTVVKTATKQLLNSFTLTPKSSKRELLTGKNGGFTATIRLKLSDGTVVDGIEVVPTEGNPICPPLVL